MRNKYNLSHLVSVTGHIGRLQTLTVVPVAAGDSIELSISGIFRLATTRQEIVSECQIDLCAFFVPHRHVWGTEWTDAVKRGIQYTTPLSEGPARTPELRKPFYLGIKECGATINKALPYGYNSIFRRYFMVPCTSQTPELSATDMLMMPLSTGESDTNWSKYGTLAARLPHILNGGTLINDQNADLTLKELSPDDYGVPVDQDNPVAGTGMLDIRDFKAIQQRYRSVQEQNWFAAFYSDIMQQKWKVPPINTDADQRPTYLGRSTQFVSGADVNGTDAQTLGSFVGKTLDRISFKLNRKFFQEHGNLWIMMLPRFPMSHLREQHPLLANASPNLKLLLADPTIWAGEKPVPYDPGNWLAGGSLYAVDGNMAQQPYGQEYRYQPNRIDDVFQIIQGFPYTDWDSANLTDWYYYKNNEYFDTFETNQLAQWRAYTSVNCTRLSALPSVETSIMAGA